MGLGLWGRKRGDGSMGKENFFHLMIQLIFLYWCDSVGVESDYLFCCLFLDYIFWLGTENVFTLYGSYDFFHIGMKA